ncbi:hypothetical protein LSAT2_017019, partial [Lamellibrachia satsuma]
MPPKKRGPSQPLRGKSANSRKAQTIDPATDVRASARRRPVATTSSVTSCPSATTTHLAYCQLHHHPLTSLAAVQVSRLLPRFNTTSCTKM